LGQGGGELKVEGGEQSRRDEQIAEFGSHKESEFSSHSFGVLQWRRYASANGKRQVQSSIMFGSELRQKFCYPRGGGKSG
jgi:hypothetical protein